MTNHVGERARIWPAVSFALFLSCMPVGLALAQAPAVLLDYTDGSLEDAEANCDYNNSVGDSCQRTGIAAPGRAGDAASCLGAAPGSRDVQYDFRFADTADTNRVWFYQLQQVCAEPVYLSIRFGGLRWRSSAVPAGSTFWLIADSGIPTQYELPPSGITVCFSELPPLDDLTCAGGAPPTPPGPSTPPTTPPGPSTPAATTGLRFVGNASFGLVDHNASLSFTIRYDCAAGFTQPLDDVKVVLAARSVPYPLDGAAHAVISVQVGNMVCGATFTADLPPTPFDPPAPAPYSFSQPPAGTWRFALLASTPATTHDYRNFPGQVTLNPSQTSFRDVQVTGVAAETATAVEYYHGPFDHYFVTANPDEVAALDAGSFSGWSRTGKSFRVYMNAATVPAMCRFFSTSFGQLSSHFYTSNVDECASVKANPNWLYEGLVFHVSAPADDGTCPFDSQSLYRLYNNGQGGAPNHRYTTSFDVRAEMLARGWIPEGHGTVGVVACTPL